MSCSKRMRCISKPVHFSTTSNGKFCDTMYPKHNISIPLSVIVFNKRFLVKILLFLNLFEAFGISKVSHYFSFYLPESKL